MGITQVQTCYNDGVNGESCFSPVTLTQEQDPNDPNLLWDDTPLTVISVNAGRQSDGYDESYPYIEWNYGGIWAGWSAAQGTQLQWYTYLPTLASTAVTDFDQYYFKIDLVSILSGTASNEIGSTGTSLWTDSSRYGEVASPFPSTPYSVWTDYWGYEPDGDGYQSITVKDATQDNVPEHIIVDITMAKSNGAGGPDLLTAKTKRVEFIAWAATNNWTVYDAFPAYSTGTTLDGKAPTGNRPPGEVWSVVSGSWEYASSLIRPDTVGDNLAVFETDVSDYTIHVGIGDVFGDIFLVARYVDSSNYWYGGISDYTGAGADGDPVLVLVSVVAGVETEVDRLVLTGYGSFNSDRTDLRMTVNGENIEVAVDESYITTLSGWTGGDRNGELVASTTSTQHQTATKCGLLGNVPSGSTFGTEVARFGVDQADAFFRFGHPDIIWGADLLTSTVVDTPSAGNNLYFNETATGCGYYVDASTIGYVDVIDAGSLPFTTGEYLVMYTVADDTTSDASKVTLNGTNQPGVWVDLYRANLQFDAVNTSPGAYQEVLLNVSVAVDDGAGAPIPGTQKTRQVKMISDDTE
jgi:hypothetical protein